MADTVSQLVTDVLTEGGFDATPDQALRWLTRRHRKMVVRSRCYRKTASLGSTVANQGDYALPSDLFEVFEVLVSGLTYGKGRHTDISVNAAGWLLLDGEGGVVAPEESSTGALEIALIPAPDTAGLPITVRGAFRPPDLLTADDTTLKIPEDFTEALVAGAIAQGLSGALGDFRPDLATAKEAAFVEGCEELRRQVNRRYRGPGPATIRVQGINA